MMPQLVTIHNRRRDGRWLRLYVPILPVLVVLSPILLLAVLGGLVACLVFRISPAGAARAIGHLLMALRGTQIELEQGHMAVLVSVR